jgi:hypothetical protein
MPRQWTDQQKEDASIRAKLSQPWRNSTGPRSAEGKRVSARNSYKHGFYSYEITLIKWYARFATMRLKQLNVRINIKLQKQRNELITREKGHPIFSPDLMTFYPHTIKDPFKFFGTKMHKVIKKQTARLKVTSQEIFAIETHDFKTHS